MKAIAELKKFNLVSWPTLLVGLQKGWAVKSDVADYATKLLSDGLDNDDENIAVLASANACEE